MLWLVHYESGDCWAHLGVTERESKLCGRNSYFWKQWESRKGKWYSHRRRLVNLSRNNGSVWQRWWPWICSISHPYSVFPLVILLYCILSWLFSCPILLQAPLCRSQQLQCREKKSHPMSLHTATFAIIYGLLFRKHAFPHPDTLNMACTAAHIAVHWIRLIASIQPLYYAFPGFHVTPGCSSVTDAIHWNQRGKVSIANIVFTWIFSIYEAGM